MAITTVFAIQTNGITDHVVLVTINKIKMAAANMAVSIRSTRSISVVVVTNIDAYISHDPKIMNSYIYVKLYP